MTSPDLEFAISQYLDGTLPPLERERLDQRLATDVGARQLLEEYRRLDAALRDTPDLPAVNWDRFANEISRAVAIAPAPVKTYTLRRIQWAAPLAAAACIAIVAGLAVRMYLGVDSPTVSSPAVQGSEPVVIVQGPSIETSAKASIIEISVGPAPAIARERNWRYAEGVVTRPSSVIIASGLLSDTSSEPSPY